MDLATILSFTSVPGLDAAREAVVLLKEGLDEASIYREQCKNLCTNASTLLAALQEEQNKGLHIVAVDNAATEIELVCNSAYKRMQECRRADTIRTWLNRDEIRADLQKLEKRLETAARTFSITAQMEIVREQEFQRGFAESQMRDMEEMKGMLRQIVRDRDGLRREIPSLQPTEVQSLIVSIQEELQNERPRGSQSPGHRQAKMELERGLLEIRKRTGILPPSADLTREVRRIGDAPFDTGMTADIWLGEWLGEHVALKALRNIGNMNEKAKKGVLSEVEIWRGLQHPHVLRLYGMCYFTPFVYLVSPLAINGNALRFLELHPEADCIRLLAGAASGLAYLHTRQPPVIHGDLRAANILVMEDREACISDFGLARLEEVAENTTTTSSNTAGACRWMAPELVNPELVYSSEAKRTTATDVWSFAITAYELFTGRRPYDHRSMDVHVIQDIVKQFRHPRPRGTIENRGLSDEVWDMMCRCWSQDPARRPKMPEVAEFFGKLAPRTGSHISERSGSQSTGLDGPSRGWRPGTSPQTPLGPPAASPKSILEELTEEDVDIPSIEELQNEQPRASQPPEDGEAKMEPERGSLEILRLQGGTLLPSADLTREVRRIGDAPFDSGMTADDWLGEWLGKHVALKALRNIANMNEKAKKGVLREVEIWRGLQHRHVLRLYGICYFTPFVYLVSPLAVNGNALRFLELNPEADRIKLLAGAASGLAFLHTYHVIHGDLRAANILVLEDGEACISDFGLARLEEVAENTTTTSSNTAGACRWMAPELVNPELVYSSEPRRTTATDVWSFAITAYEVFTGRRPYDHRTMDFQVIQDIANQFRHPRPRGTIENRGLSDEVWDMMCRCWSQEPAGRPRMPEVAGFFEILALRRRSGSQSVGLDWSGPSRGLRPGIPPLKSSGPPVASAKPILPEEDKEIAWISEVMARAGNEAISPADQKLLSPQITASVDLDQRHPHAGFYQSSMTSISYPSEPATTVAPSIWSSDTYYTNDDGSSLYSHDQTTLFSVRSAQVTNWPQRTTSKPAFSEALVNEDEEEHDWPSTGPFEVHLSEDRKSVETGTLDGIIRLLALSSISTSRDLRQTFFKIYPNFADDGEIFDSLREQYKLAGLSDVGAQKRAKIRYNVLALMQDWIEAQPSVLSNEAVASRIKSFASTVTEPDTLARKGREVLKLLDRLDVTRPQRRGSRSTISTHSGSGDVKWNQLSPVEIATQLTAIEGQLFRNITIVDLLVYFQGSEGAGRTLESALRACVQSRTETTQFWAAGRSEKSRTDGPSCKIVRSVSRTAGPLPAERSDHGKDGRPRRGPVWSQVT